MADDNKKRQLEVRTKYEADCRVACQYGEKCYQKNPQHHEKYKHPPKIKTHSPSKNKTTHMKRSVSDREDELNDTEGSLSPPAKYRRGDVSPQVSGTIDSASIATTSIKAPDKTEISDDSFEYEDFDTLDIKNFDDSSNENMESSSVNNVNTTDLLDEQFASPEYLKRMKNIILKLFLTKMPNDFYKFFDFCRKLRPNDPSSALQSANLKLVGPYDVLNGKINDVLDDNEDRYLIHWRYFYDPPEFQTILKGNDVEGLHYGYWRDTCEENPNFVAKNFANKDSKIVPVAPNIFGAVLAHLEQRTKAANIFEKPKISGIINSLKAFATENGIALELSSTDMHARDRAVLTKTFHGAGIVVPYNKKTQLGYRNLAITESHLRKLLRQIDTAETEAIKNQHVGSLEEVIRLATIAADECDFGTPLELGHDLFSSGVESVQRAALLMLKTAYNLLKRPQFLKIITVHMNNRKKDCNLSVL